MILDHFIFNLKINFKKNNKKIDSNLFYFIKMKYSKNNDFIHK